MANLSLYLPDELDKRVRRDAQECGIPISKWFALVAEDVLARREPIAESPAPKRAKRSSSTRRKTGRCAECGGPGTEDEPLGDHGMHYACAMAHREHQEWLEERNRRGPVVDSATKEQTR
jgi:hypothetical protein